MPLLFSYGTFQQEEVQRSIFGRLLRGPRDELVGFRQDRVALEEAQASVDDGELESEHTRREPAALGLASRPTRSRSAMTSRWFMVSNRPMSRHAANQRYTVVRGGNSCGSSRQGTPPRST